ncbi:MAG: radical SAM protein [Methanomicrobiales archaeon]|nr:radical SAM protein [Methanomicrobiales archaeon]
MLTEGCRLCYEGAKMVLFITGRCRRSCWYCPIPGERKGREVVFANEREVHGPDEVIHEARLMSALGSSLTGGEPLLALERVIEYAGALKSAFGEGHHIHLYTGEAPDEGVLMRMRGLVDEIRIHPPVESWGRIMESDHLYSAVRAKELGYSAGFEVPCLPEVEALAPALEVLDFMNINELEWGELSAEEMRRKGYEPSDDLHNAVKHSAKWARRIRHHPKVHFCPSGFKDSIQLRERLKRIARNTARPFDEITVDGTIRYGLLEPSCELDLSIIPLKVGKFQQIDGRYEMDWRFLKRLAKRLPGRKCIIERYPNQGVVVEVIPL